MNTFTVDTCASLCRTFTWKAHNIVLSQEYVLWTAETTESRCVRLNVFNTKYNPSMQQQHLHCYPLNWWWNQVRSGSGVLFFFFLTDMVYKNAAGGLPGGSSVEKSSQLGRGLLNSTPFSGPCGHERISSCEWERRPQNAIHIHRAAMNVTVVFLHQLETSLTERPAHHSSYSLLRRWLYHVLILPLSVPWVWEYCILTRDFTVPYTLNICQVAHTRSMSS